MAAVVKDGASSTSSGNVLVQIVQFLQNKGIKVVVWDMDLTMSKSHCGTGQLKTELDQYVDNVSKDFVELMGELQKHPFKYAVATGSDPKEYELPGQSRDTHLCGGDLAIEILRKYCPDTVDSFECMIGFDNRLHGNQLENKGKRFHMREIAKHYNVKPCEMILIDDHRANLENEDGWHGVLVREPKEGFRIADFEFHMNPNYNIVIVPGNGCVPVRPCNFYGWAEKQFQDLGFTVNMAPDTGMPDPVRARKSIWLPYIKDELKAGPNSVLVGHSSGAVAGLRFAEENKLHGLVLIAAYDHHLDDYNERLSGYFDGDFNWDKIKSNCTHIVQFAGVKDSLVPIEIQRRVAKHLHPKVLYIEQETEDHFFPPPFLQLIETINTLTKF